ncbi:LemA family protein, partial [Aeromicrobium sp.]
MWIAIAVVVVLIVGFVVVAFNKLRKADIGAQEALGGIDVQLTRRADLIPNLVNTVKGYATHERAVFDEVTAARAGAAQAAKSGTVEEKAAAQG